MTTSANTYLVLTEADQKGLRLERIRLIEADLFRARLQLEEALSDMERRGVAQDIAALQARLQPHYAALEFTSTAEQEGDDSSTARSTSRSGA